MKTSDQINELAAALSKAQGGFTNPERNRAVKVRLKENKGEYTFHYTTLDRIIETIRQPMSDNGLAFSQSVTLDSDWAIVTTRIMHASGQWIEDTLPVKPDGFGPQQVGSAITYGKRYSLTALLGIASDEDDDGNLGSGHTTEEIRNSPPPKRKDVKPTAKQIAAQHGMTTADQLQSAFDKAQKEIQKAVQNHDLDYLHKIGKLVGERVKEGVISEAEDACLIVALQTAERQIEALKNQPDQAAA